MKVIVDAMGGDNAPDAIVEGALRAIKESGVDIVLVGRGEEILRAIDRLGISELPRGVEMVNASEVIETEDDPASVIRLKKDSSLTVALTLLRDGRGEALVSAGSTGAILSGATLIVKRVRGIRRAAMAPYIPNTTGGFILIDCGANVECSPEYILQFAYMGSFYAENILGIESPRVGQLNNGTEHTKGTPLQHKAYELLEKAKQSGDLNFIGNVEGKDAMTGACDVLVCDGFIGNIFLKAVEGAASLIMSELKKVYMKSVTTKLSALLIKKEISGLRKMMNPDSIGGTAMLGISKPVIKAHGSSNAAAISSAVRQAKSAAETNIAKRLEENISRMKIDDNDDANHRE